MSASSQSKKDKEMAAYLKAKGVKRTTCNCPICHHLVGLDNLEKHLRQCKG
jgi:hypothetical protein